MNPVYELKMPKPRNIDEYIARFPPDVQEILQTLRKTIRKAAPDAEEKISYQIAAFALKGDLVYFAAFKSHIGLYPRTTAIAKFKRELSRYETSKGTIKFPLGKPLPSGLISKIVKFRVKENLEKSKTKTARRR